MNRPKPENLAEWWRVHVTAASLYKPSLRDPFFFILIHFSSSRFPPIPTLTLRLSYTIFRVSLSFRSSLRIASIGAVRFRFLCSIWKFLLLLLSWLEIRAKHRRICFWFAFQTHRYVLFIFLSLSWFSISIFIFFSWFAFCFVESVMWCICIPFCLVLKSKMKQSCLTVTLFVRLLGDRAKRLVLIVEADRFVFS